MSTIDEIMRAALTLGDQRLMATHNRAAREDVLEAEAAMRNLIAAALADAERKGAEQMREACASVSKSIADRQAEMEGFNAPESPSMSDGARECEISISALPLPTGSQPAESKPGEWIEWKGGKCPIANGVLHQIRMRDGYLSSDDLEAYSWIGWEHTAGENDIVAYRVLT